MAEWTKATVLKTVVLRTPVNEWLNPMNGAPSNEGGFLVPATPPSGRHRGWVLVMVGAWLTDPHRFSWDQEGSVRGVGSGYW